MIGYSSGLSFEPLTRSALRQSLTMIIVLMVISSSSPILMLVNPALAASSFSTDSSTSGPSTISQDGTDFATQAALQIPRTFQSTDIVSSTGIYEVTFITSTTGAIDKIEIAFPVGTNIGASGSIERVGIGGGTLTKVGSTLTYDVTTPVSVPAGTFIRLELSGIKNPATPSTSFTATITTRDSGGNLIDGPSQTNVYTIKQIGTSEIADNAITTPKIADDSITPTKPDESYEKRIQLLDDAAGNALGWNPNGAITFFSITASAVTGPGSFVSIQNQNCRVTSVGGTGFTLQCAVAPGANEFLDYLVTNVPLHVNE